MDIVMSRTSVSQGVDLLEMTTPIENKERLSFMDDRPVLLLCEEELMIDAERALLAKAKKIGQVKSVSLFALEIENLVDKQKYSEETAHRTDSLLKSGTIIHIPLDEEGPAFAGDGGRKVINQFLWEGIIANDGVHEASFWMKIDENTHGKPRVIFHKINRKGITVFEGDYKYQNAFASQNGWLRIEWLFDRSHPEDSFRIKLEGHPAYVDEFLVRPLIEKTIIVNGRDTLINNYLYRLSR